ncbi:MAG: N-acetyltransferase [Halobacteriovoraceae bacterium]|nr:N-acetyltransferase [Halobacteriovoraceae bacterium]
MSHSFIRIDFATVDDIHIIKKFILDIAEYEKLSHMVKTTEENLKHYLFGSHKYAECLIARIDEKPIGFALFHPTFSTFEGKPGIHLEDLFVLKEFRGKGAGKALLQRLAKITIDRGFKRLEWIVLDWNKPSIDFYDSIGSKAKKEWILYRFDGGSLQSFANSSD